MSATKRNSAVVTRLLVSGVALVALSSSGCDPKGCGATIEVRVRDDQGQGIEGAAVTLDHECCTSYLLDDGTRRQACAWQTGADGRVAVGVDGFDNTVCEVSADATGFQSGTRSVTFTADNYCSTVPLNFDLKPR